MVNVRRRDFDLDAVEDLATVSPRQAAVIDDSAPRTVTLRLPPALIWRIARNRLLVKAWALMGGARITALDGKNREYRTVIARDDIWLFDPRLAHSIRAEGDGCVLCLTLVPSVNVDEALSLMRSVEADAGAI